mgnify:CR=1 FL=1
MTNKILKDLEGVFSKVFNKEVFLSQDTTAKDIQGWDSLRHMMLINAIEKKFRIKFSFKEVQSFASVSDIVKAINVKILTD